MRKMSLSIITWSLIFCLSPVIAADSLFSVNAFSFPFRSVASANDMFAARFNPAGLAITRNAEFGWFHQFTSHDRGANNSLLLRGSGTAISVSWIDEGGNTSRKEWLLATGMRLSPKVALGGSFRQISSIHEDLDDKRVFDLGLMLMPSPNFWLGARWENVGHEDQANQSTQGLIVSGIRIRPAGPRITLAADWFYPEKGDLSDSEFRISAHIRAQRGFNIRASIDSRELITIEFRMLEGRNSAGVEARTTDFSEFSDGTFYISTRDKPYPNSIGPRPIRR